METNLNKIKEMAKLFLRLPIQTDERIPPMICVYHPFLQSSITYVDNQLVNLLEDAQTMNAYIEYMDEQIDGGDLTKIYMLIRTPYKLTFLKHCYEYLSEKDLAEYFADAWVLTENPNQDVNCPIPYLVKMFKKCNKQYLMVKEDYEIYQALPETFTIYRGVAVGRNPKGLSWTRNLETAKWFAHRFDNKDEQGYIQVGTAKKENVLAYFNTRNEDEIVYDSKNLQISILEEE